MARCSREVGIIKSFVLGAALAMALALPAQAQENKLTLSATTAFTTDYIFRGISNSGQNPAVQPEFDAYYGIFYAGIWGSNTSFSPDDVEIDYYVGMTPKWGPATFDFAVLGYTFPGATDLDYLELKAGVTLGSGPWSFRVSNFYSPDNFGLGITSDAVEGQLGYAFNNKLFNFFTPGISGLVGYQSYEDLLPDYTYWNVGLTLGFLEHWSADVRYWDTSYSDAECFANTGSLADLCGARVVGTLKATF